MTEVVINPPTCSGNRLTCTRDGKWSCHLSSFKQECRYIFDVPVFDFKVRARRNYTASITERGLLVISPTQPTVVCYAYPSYFSEAPKTALICSNRFRATIGGQDRNLTTMEARAQELTKLPKVKPQKRGRKPSKKLHKDSPRL